MRGWSSSFSPASKQQAYCRQTLQYFCFWRRKKRFTVLNKITRMIPGIMVARKQAKTVALPTQPYSIIDMLGGISRPKTAQLEMREPINPFSYPFSSSLGDIIRAYTRNSSAGTSGYSTEYCAGYGSNNAKPAFNFAEARFFNRINRSSAYSAMINNSPGKHEQRNCKEQNIVYLASSIRQ